MNNNEEIERICRKLIPVIGNKAKMLWYAYLTHSKPGQEELERIIRILEVKYFKKNLEKEKVCLDPPDIRDSFGSYYLGKVIYNEKELFPLYLNQEDFIKQIGIFSITGEGKTNISQLLAIQLLKNKIPWLVIDWKRSWRNL